jgi:hypothetical protein
MKRFSNSKTWRPKKSNRRNKMAVTRELVNGKQATVSHLNDKWEPCDPKDAKLVKVVFDDGGIVFGITKEEAVQQS